MNLESFLGRYEWEKAHDQSSLNVNRTRGRSLNTWVMV